MVEAWQQGPKLIAPVVKAAAGSAERTQGDTVIAAIKGDNLPLVRVIPMFQALVLADNFNDGFIGLRSSRGIKNVVKPGGVFSINRLANSSAAS